MLRISLRKLCKESLLFFVKNLDIMFLYAFVLPFTFLLSMSAPSNVQYSLDIPFIQSLRFAVANMSPIVYFAIVIIVNIYSAIAILTITKTLLNRLQGKRQSLRDAIGYVCNVLFVRGAWWYFLVYLILYSAQAIRLIFNAQPILAGVIMALYFVAGIVMMYFVPIIVDNYHSFQHTLMTSWGYLKRSSLVLLKVFLLVMALSMLSGALIVILSGAVALVVGSVGLWSIATAAIALSTLLTTYITAIGLLKLYLHLKAND